MKKIILGVLIVLIGISLFFFVPKSSFEKKEDTKPKKVKVIKKEKKKIFTGIFADNMEKAQILRKSMSLDEKVGQIFLVRYEEENTQNELTNLYPGGYLLFAKDFQYENSDSIREKISNLNNSSKIPLAIAVDEEGGIVNRVSKFKQFRNVPFPSVRDLYLEGGMDRIKQVEIEKADLLLSLGINLNLAPVADVSQNPKDFIYKRSLGEDVDTTSNYIREVVKTMREHGISGCLKHFPGYGSNIDTHTDIAIDDRDYNTFIEKDFKPFEAGIEESVPMILVSHNIINSMDSSTPSSLSKRVHEILRNDLSFSGIIITDDLAMGAIEKYTNGSSAAVMALNARNDLIITSDFESDFNLVKEEVSNNEESLKLLNTAVDRILAWKYTYKILK